MLNKNQSKKWNSWKYALIIPILIGFLLYFQVNVIAQEKHSTVNAEVISTKDISVVIDKNSTDQQLKEASEQAKAQGVTLKFSKVKRNSAGEIVAIKAVYKDQNGNSGTSQINGDEAIKPMRFFKDDHGAIGFGTAKKIRIFKNGNQDNKDGNDDGEIIISTDFAEAPEAPEAAEIPEGVEAPEAPEAPEPPTPADKHKKVIIKKFKDKNGKISMTVNGETVDIDVDKIVDEALAGLNFSFDFDSDDAQENAQEQMKRAKIQIERMRPQMERAKREMERSRPEMEDAKRELEDAKRDMENAKREMEDARRQLDQSRKELEVQKAQLQKSKKSK